MSVLDALIRNFYGDLNAQGQFFAIRSSPVVIGSVLMPLYISLYSYFDWDIRSVLGVVPIMWLIDYRWVKRMKKVFSEIDPTEAPGASGDIMAKYLGLILISVSLSAFLHWIVD